MNQWTFGSLKSNDSDKPLAKITKSKEPKLAKLMANFAGITMDNEEMHQSIRTYFYKLSYHTAKS